MKDTADDEDNDDEDEDAEWKVGEGLPTVRDPRMSISVRTVCRVYVQHLHRQYHICMYSIGINCGRRRKEGDRLMIEREREREREVERGRER